VTPWRPGVPQRDPHGRDFPLRNLPPRGAGVSSASFPKSKRGRDARATAGRTAGAREGNALSADRTAGSNVEITFDRGGVDLDAVPLGAIVWKTDDPTVRRRLETTFARDIVARRVPLTAHVTAPVGERLTVTVRDDLGHEAAVWWDKPLERAQKFPLTRQVFAEQFGRLGDTPFELVGSPALTLRPTRWSPRAC
jgi:hypothetical protein